jgi:oligopeptidase B
MLLCAINGFVVHCRRNNLIIIGLTQHFNVKKLIYAALLGTVGLYACQSNNSTPDAAANKPSAMPPSVFQPQQFTAPHPAQKPKELIGANGDKRVDEYYWLNERDNKEVKAYLEAENRFHDSVMAPVAALREQLYAEMKARIKEDDNSVPYFDGGYWYYTRFETDKEYPIHARVAGQPDQHPTLPVASGEQILIDVNQLAAGKAYCVVGGMNVSPDGHLLFYTVDYTGRNLFEGRVKDLKTNQLQPATFKMVAGGSAWSADGSYLFYDTKDATTLRSDRVWRHKVGTSAKQDVEVFYEKDETAYASLAQSKDGAYAFINHGYSQNVETHFLDLKQPTGTFQVIQAREKDRFYDVEHHNGQFVIRTNHVGRNFAIMTTPVSQPARDNWKPLVKQDVNILISGIEVFKDFLVISERESGLQQIRIMNWADGQTHRLDFGEPTYDASPMYTPDYNAPYLRYYITSLKTPYSVVDYTVASKQKTMRKTEPVLGGFDSNNYVTEFKWATASDGTKVPVSIVYRKGTKLDGSAPCFLVGYGSYGFSYDPGFNKSVISLVDRGFVHAIAHVRGGMEMGYDWYENGKLMKKMNTFTDFIACTEMLIKDGYSSADRMFAQGGSAGGLLMGAVANMRPDLYKGIIAGVPFVDVVTTMSDPTIPLTTGEYTEWGNPADPAAYAYMKSYSPYDNVKAQAYPNMLVKTSFADSQVQYFEPAKWVARLRDKKTDGNMLLFHTNMSGSHGGASGRFERLKERAQEYGWMLGLLGQSGALK